MVASPINPLWNMRQSVALLRGFQKFGFENWEDISVKCLLSSKTATQCREYFEQCRVASGEEPFFLPDMTAVDEAVKKKLAAISPLAVSVGYMPLRDDFEVVHANDAEVLLADMEFGDEGDIDCGKDWNDLKLRVLHNYNLKLDERQARKRFVLDRELLDFKRTQLAARSLFHSQLIFTKQTHTRETKSQSTSW